MDTNNFECLNQFQYLGAVRNLDNDMDNMDNDEAERTSATTRRFERKMFRKSFGSTVDMRMG